MIDSPKQFNSAGNEKKSPVRRFFLILSLALPVAVLAAGILIIKSPYILPDGPPLQRNIIGGLFIAYSFFRIYQVFLKNKHESS